MVFRWTKRVVVEGKFFGSDYVLGSKIGSGAMGTVYRAESRSTGEVFAIKILRPEHSSDRKRLTRFINEREALARVNHSNVVAIDDLVMEGDLFGIVMEFVDGGDLRDLLHETPMTEYQIVIFAEGMAAGLEAIHSAHIVHRDLKPENILVVERHGSFLPKVADFGIARLLDDSLTGTSGVSGTLRYMSPEVSDERFGDVGPAADMYSLGVILFELLTGDPPYTYSSPMQLLLAHAYDDIPHVSGIDPELNDLVRTMLAKDSQDRPTVAELRYRLAEIRAYLESEVDNVKADPVQGLNGSHSPGADPVEPNDSEPNHSESNDNDEVDVVQSGMVLMVGPKEVVEKAQDGDEDQPDSIDLTEEPAVDGSNHVAPNTAPLPVAEESDDPNGQGVRSQEASETKLAAPAPDELVMTGSNDGVVDATTSFTVSNDHDTGHVVENVEVLAVGHGHVNGSTQDSSASQTAFITNANLDEMIDRQNPLALKYGDSDNEPTAERSGILEVDSRDVQTVDSDQPIANGTEPPERNGDQIRQHSDGATRVREASVSELAQESAAPVSSLRQVADSEPEGGVNWRIVLLVSAGLLLVVSLAALMFRLGASNRGEVETVNTTVSDASLQIDDANRPNTQPSERNEGEGVGATASNTPNGSLVPEDSQRDESGGDSAQTEDSAAENNPVDGSPLPEGTDNNSGVGDNPVPVDNQVVDGEQDADDDALTGDADPAVVGAPGLVRNVVGIPGDKSASWSWSPPVDDGGLGISYYIVTAANEDDVTVELPRHQMASLTNGRSYSIAVRACNLERCGEQSSLSAVVPAAPPAIPESLQASVGPVSINLTWKSPEFDGGDSVKFFQVSDGGNTIRQSNSTGYSWPSPDQWPARFRVRACNDAGCGGWTAYESVTRAEPVTLAKPTNFTLGRADSAVDLQWSAVPYSGSGSVTYEIEGHGNEVRTVSQVTYRWSDLVNGFSYPFRVRACVDSACGGWTQFQHLTPAGVPGKPSGFTAQRIGGVLQLSWTQPELNGAEITKYQVDQADSDPIDVDGTSVEISAGVLADRSYSFRVRACNPICGPPTDWKLVPAG